MSSITKHFLSSVLRRRPMRPASAVAPPERTAAAPPPPPTFAPAPAELPMLAVMPDEPSPSWAEPAPAAVLREQLAVLEAERALASLHGLDRDVAYAADLRDELNAVQAAYVGTAVVEIAVMRAEFDGRLQG
ncbi:MAG: hypothetical protein JHC95_19060 [Solirubrobacteraceae bacterium]|nr:hypothetical protein [Solirubrobacteraceae bacterium]